MRISLAVIVATVLGVAIGMGTAALRIGLETWDIDQLKPKVVVDHLEYDFGTMDIDGEGSHEFTFANEGEGTLVLTGTRSSCGCTVSRFESSNISPGESAKVTLTWRSDEKEGPYRQTAVILTNDPRRRRVELSVRGEITVAVRAIPPVLVFTSLRVGQSITGKVGLYCYLDEPLEIRGLELSDQHAAEQFEVTSEPLPADQLEEEANARSGRLLKVTVRPGLPLGGFRQRILVKTNLELTPTVEIPVVGEVVSDISIIGEGWNDRTRVLDLDTISSQEGIRRQLWLHVCGAHRKEVNFTLVQPGPEPLEVELGETIHKDKFSRTPLFIRIPENSRPAYHMGSELGEIVIRTSHPRKQELTILVRFAVEG